MLGRGCWQLVIEGYARCLESKRAEWDKESNVEHMWEQKKWAMVESTREVCESVSVGGKDQKSVWWNDVVKTSVERRKLPGRKCWEIEMGLLKKDV